MHWRGSVYKNRECNFAALKGLPTFGAFLVVKLKKMIVKTCGLRDHRNIEAVAALPVDWLGFIFYSGSSRYVKPEGLASWLTRHASRLEGKKRVGVFVNAELEQLMNIVHDCELDYVQLHGDESPDYCAELQLLWTVGSIRSAKIIKAFHVDTAFDFSGVLPYSPYCAYFLFDTKAAGAKGGTGQQFDWALLEQYTGQTPFLLSGGIGPDDAERVAAFRHPSLAGWDLNSRFETAPGIKNTEALSVFLQEIIVNDEGV